MQETLRQLSCCKIFIFEIRHSTLIKNLTDKMGDILVGYKPLQSWRNDILDGYKPFKQSMYDILDAYKQLKQWLRGIYTSYVD